MSSLQGQAGVSAPPAPSPGLPLASGQCPPVPYGRNEIAGCAPIKQERPWPLCCAFWGSGDGWVSAFSQVWVLHHSPMYPPSSCPSFCLSSIIHLPSHPPLVHLPSHLSIYPSISNHPSVRHPSTHPSTHSSICSCLSDHPFTICLLNTCFWVLL